MSEICRELGGLGNILAVDTATEACSVALLSRGTVHKRFAVVPRQHHRVVFEMCQAVLAAAQLDLNALDALVYGRGPGSFTGVRIAASLVQALAYAHTLPVVALSDLRAVAWQAFKQNDATHAVVAMDACMGEVYYGYFSNEAGTVKALGDEGVIAPHKLAVPDTFVGIGAGTAWPLYKDEIKQLLGTRLTHWYASMLPDAVALLHLAMPQLAANRTVSAAAALPIYLRHPIAADQRHANEDDPRHAASAAVLLD